MEGEQIFGLDENTNLWSSVQYTDLPQSSSVELTIGKEVEEAVKIAMQASIPSLVGAVQKGMQDLLPIMVEEMRKMAQSSTITSTSRSLPVHLGDSHTSRRLQLHIEGQLPKRLFTGRKLLNQDGFSLKVVLRDEYRNIVDFGSESSERIAIVVLPGDFMEEDNISLTESFNKEVVKEREEKPQLLVGECKVNLHKGTASIGDCKFTDNSSWIRSGKFKLGAKIERISPGVIVREAISNAFEVKERRGEFSQKKKDPSCDDKVWCLNKIARNGEYHKRLEAKGINNVMGLLNLYDANPKSLKDILQVSDSRLQEIMNHAALARPTADAHKGNEVTMFANGNQTGFIEGQGLDSEMLSTGTVADPAIIRSWTNMQYLDTSAAVPDFSIPNFNFEEFFNNAHGEPLSQPGYDSNEFRTKFSPKWCVIRAAKRVISLRILIASRPAQKKQKI